MLTSVLLGGSPMIKVLVVDDHEIVRAGLRLILKDAPGIRIIAEAKSGEEAVAIVKDKQPDVVMMDINMPGMGGLEATKRLLKVCPGCKVIVVTVYVDDPFPQRLFKAGASGYLTKGCDVEEIVEAVATVMAGKHYISPEVARQMALSTVPGKESPFEGLSQRELQVMLMVTQGLKIQDIADSLHVSPKTISTYRYRLFAKLGVDSDVELTRLAMRYGLVEDGESLQRFENNG